MEVWLHPDARKYLAKVPEPQRGLLKKVLAKLGQEPPEGDIKKLTGMDGYRVRKGGYRILFDVTDTCVVVYKISPRGQAYKEN
jgi:mRNA interferase RelE/StbE